MDNKENVLDSLSKILFWDIDIKSFDIEQHARYLIQRVLEYGQWNDWKLISHYYGKDRIVDECKKMRTLEPRALSFICCISETSKEDYRCYHTAQSNPTLWNS